MSTVDTSRRRTLFRRTTVASLIAVVLVVLAGCDGSANDAADTTPDTAPPATTVAPDTSPPVTTADTAPVTTADTAAVTTVDTSPATTTASPATTTTPPAGTTPSAAGIVRAYFHRDLEVLGPVGRPVSGEPVATSRAALEALLAGPTDEERAIGFGSEVPAGTRLLGVRIENGVSFVDLSSEFESGGGSSSMAMRLLQVVYTATQFDNVDAVRLLLDGVAVDVFSGEGLIVDHPLTRAEFDLDPQVPIILVEGPLPFETPAGQVRVYGTANVFEATVQVRVALDSGEVLFEGFTNALCGTGCRGAFDVTIPVSAVGPATVTVFENSSEDGSEINVVEIPITLS